ncbi:MAG TPA: tetratricopeptide repeat protein [bacterium]|nr:tetratricopeptide repeat protein [bacterium]HQP99843.1 tetratricopeptide repeat protein [bacterium]
MHRPIRRPKFSFNIPEDYLEGVDLYNRRHYAEALPKFRSACEQKPRYADLHYAMARCLVMLKDDQAALLELSEALQLNPSYVDCLLEVAFIMARLGDIGQARSYFAEAIRFFRYGASEENPTGDLQESCASHFEKGLQFCQQDNIEAANREFLRACNLKSEEVLNQYNDGVFAYGQGDLELARYLMECVLQADAHLLDAYHLLGQIHLSQGREKEAIEIYRKALSIRDDYPDFYAGLGEACLVSGKPEEALSYLEKAVSFNPRYSEAYFYLGRAYLGQNRLVEAKQAFENLLRHRPQDGLALLSLGEVLEGLGQSAEAYVAYERAAVCPESMELARRRLEELATEG